MNIAEKQSAIRFVRAARPELIGYLEWEQIEEIWNAYKSGEDVVELLKEM